MKCRKCIVTISLSVTIMALITMSAMAIDAGLRDLDKKKQVAILALVQHRTTPVTQHLLRCLPVHPFLNIPLL
ncbi:MAG: hypothetical protein ACNYVW_04675 [Methanosarcinales archaeon]